VAVDQLSLNYDEVFVAIMEAANARAESHA
jgi:hypothetical protein